jgi:alcohol dehydrogenase
MAQSVTQNFEFYCNTRVAFGVNARAKVFDILKKENWTKAGIVVDENLLKVEKVSVLISALSERSEKVVIAKCKIAEPTYDSLDEMRVVFNDQKLDVMIGIGGGSALDMAKAMAVLVHNRKAAIEYRGFDKMTEKVLPIIAITTTAGTGSEVTPNASFVDSKEKKKLGINGEAVRPKYALLDPELTLSCPAKVTISSGVDSMVHATEAYVAHKTNPIARLYAKQGFLLVSQNLPKAVAQPENIEYRTNVMLGAFFAGMALMHSGTGPSAAMSYPLGVHYHVPHGFAGGVFLPHVIRFNIQNGYYAYGDFVQDINIADPKKRAEKFIEDLDLLWKALSMPKSLKEYGFKEEEMPRFIKETMDLKGALDQNPVPFYEKQIEATLRLLKG